MSLNKIGQNKTSVVKFSNVKNIKLLRFFPNILLTRRRKTYVKAKLGN